MRSHLREAHTDAIRASFVHARALVECESYSSILDFEHDAAIAFE